MRDPQQIARAIARSEPFEKDECRAVFVLNNETGALGVASNFDRADLVTMLFEWISKQGPELVGCAAERVRQILARGQEAVN